MSGVGGENARKPLNAQGGFTQILVLVGLATASAILTAALSTELAGRSYATTLERTVRSGLAANSASARVFAAISDPDDGFEEVFGDPARTAELPVDGLVVSIRIEGEGGKIDPLTTASEIIERYLDQVDMDSSDRRSMSSRLMLARDRGDREAATVLLYAYLSAHLTAAELGQDFTPFGSGSGIDPQYASERVLRAVPGVSANDVAQIVQRQGSDMLAVRALSPYFASATGVFSVVAVVGWPDGDSLTASQAFRITTGGRALPIARP